MKKSTASYTKESLNKLFLDGLSGHILEHSAVTDFPLLLTLYPRELRLRVYLWNCTNPPGGRPANEYKAQMRLPGQKPHTRADLDYSDTRLPIIGALVNDDEEKIFVIWDANRHKNFAYCCNLQVRNDVIIGAMIHPIEEAKRKNGEIVICARPQFLYDALIRRSDILHEEIVGEL